MPVTCPPPPPPPENWSRVNVRNWAVGGVADGKAEAYAGAGQDDLNLCEKESR